MPNMADVTVKKADGTTNVVFVGKVPSAGDKSPAVFSQDSASTIRNQRPVIQVVSQSNGPKTARRVSITGKMPVLRTIGGAVSVEHEIPLTLTAAIPTAVSDSEADEAVAQFTNFCAAALIRTALSSGYAPT